MVVYCNVASLWRYYGSNLPEHAGVKRLLQGCNYRSEIIIVTWQQAAANEMSEWECDKGSNNYPPTDKIILRDNDSGIILYISFHFFLLQFQKFVFIPASRQIAELKVKSPQQVARSAAPVVTSQYLVDRGAIRNEFSSWVPILVKILEISFSLQIRKLQLPEPVMEARKRSISISQFNDRTQFFSLRFTSALIY
jgi:hypothetical protein